MARYSLPFSSSLWLLLVGVTPAEDIKLSDGSVLRGAKVIEVRPDAVIFSHDRGVTMADFTKLPQSLRAQYGYDPRKAAAHREREAASAQATATENRRLVEELEQRRMAVALREMQAGEAANSTNSALGDMQLSYRSGASGRADPTGVARLGSAINFTQQERRAADLARPELADFWQHPIVKLLGAVLGGAGGNARSDSGSEPRNWR